MYTNYAICQTPTNVSKGFLDCPRSSTAEKTTGRKLFFNAQLTMAVISGRMQQCQRHRVRGTSRTMHACGSTFLNCHRSSAECQPSELTVRSVRTDSHVSQDLQSDQSDVTAISVSQSIQSCQSEHTVMSVRA